MSFSSLRKRFIPLGQWSPDAPEFAPGFLDQIINVIPVYGVYRTLQSLHSHSKCEEQANVTGTFVHRISVDQAFDIMQPLYSEPADTPGLPKEGFQAIPGKIGGVTQEFWQALRGLVADSSTTVLFIPRDIEMTLYGYFDKPHREWDNIEDLVASFQYRISTGFTGAYDFTVEIGIVGDANNPEEPAGFTVLGSFNLSGDLSVLGDTTNNLYVFEQITIANAAFADPGNQFHYAWQFKHTIDGPVAETNEILLSPVTAKSASTMGSPDTIFGYMTEAGSSAAADIITSIDGLVAGAWPAPPTGDATFAISKALWSTDSSGVGFFFRPEFPQFVNLNNHKLRVRWSVDDAAQKVSIGLYQGINRFPGEGRLIRAWTNLPGGNEFPVLNELTLDDATQQELDDISNWEDVWVLFFAHIPTGPGALTTNTFLPQDQYDEFGLWQVIGFSSDPIESISDSLDASGLLSPSPLTIGSPSFQFHFAPFNGPREAVASMVIKVRMGTTNVDARIRVLVQLFDQSTNPAHGTNVFEVFISDPSTQEYSGTVTLSSLPNINNLRCVISAVSGATSAFRLGVADVKLEITTGISSRARLHGFAYYGPEEGDEGSGGSPIDISWLQLSGPALVSDIQSDSIRAYIGTVEKRESATQVGRLWEISSPDFSTWRDASQVGGYASNERDKSWSFCNFGSMVIATNYADPVQVLYDGDTLFEDLIGNDAAGVPIAGYGAAGGVVPRARYAATIGAFFCLANCDPLSVVGTATPYSFWCSRYAQPQYFHVGLSEWQSSVFQLVTTPGEITGLVGGEYGFIFKENSIWRVDYVCLPEIFSFTQISGEQGTVQPRSIIKVDNDVYFWGIGGIYVIRGGRELEEVAGQGSVRKYIFDSQFERFAITSHSADLESEASAKVIAGYDTYTGCILWSFQSRAAPDEWFNCDSVLVYSPRENRFTFLRGDMSSPVFPTDRMLDAYDLFSGNLLRMTGYLSLGNRQTSGQNYLMKTILGVRTVEPEHDDFPGQPEVVSFSGAREPDHNSVYEQVYRSNTIAGSSFGAPLGVEIEIHKVRAILAIENIEKAPRYQVWIEANQSPAVGDGTGRVIALDTQVQSPNGEGWLDLGTPISGEFFKFALAFAEYNDPIVKEVHGWQVVYRIAGDR